MYRAVAQTLKDREFETLKEVAAPLRRAGYWDDEMMRVLIVVEDIMTARKHKAIADTMKVLDEEGLDGLRRRLER